MTLLTYVPDNNSIELDIQCEECGERVNSSVNHYNAILIEACNICFENKYQERRLEEKEDE